MGSFGNNPCFLSFFPAKKHATASIHGELIEKRRLWNGYSYLLEVRSDWTLFKQELLFKNELCVWTIESQLLVNVRTPVEGKWVVGQMNSTLLNVKEHQLHLLKLVEKLKNYQV